MNWNVIRKLISIIAIISLIPIFLFTFTPAPTTAGHVKTVNTGINSTTDHQSSSMIISSAENYAGSSSIESGPDNKIPIIDANYNYAAQVPSLNEVDDSYFEDAVFLGDSRMQGFILYSGLTKTTSYAFKSLTTYKVFTTPLVDIGEAKVSIIDALKMAPNFSKIYIMLGVNELGWKHPSTFIDKYSELIDALKMINPNVLIYVQSILPFTYTRSSTDEIFNNVKISEYNSLLLKLAQEKEVFYLNVLESVVDSFGYVPEDATSDGIHLKKPYCKKMLEYLKTHTVDDNWLGEDYE